MAHRTDSELIEYDHNTARWFAEHRQVATVLLLGTFLWGWYGYHSMPKRKDPNIPNRVAVAVTSWPGATAEQVERLVSRPIEETMADNAFIKAPSPSDYGIKSISLPGLSLVYVQLDEKVADTRKQFSDINLKLNALNQRLPQGAGPIRFDSDFGDTAALMLSVASPPAREIEVVVRAQAIEKHIRALRAALPPKSLQPRLSVVYCFPASVSVALVRQSFDLVLQAAVDEGVLRDLHIFQGPGYVGADANSSQSDAQILGWGETFIETRLHASEIHPDAWPAVIVHDPQQMRAKLDAVAGDRYSYRELDDFTDLIQRSLQGVPEVAKVTRTGVLREEIFLTYSQERLAQYGVQPSGLKNVLSARNITLPGGSLEVGSKSITIDPSGEFTSPQAIGDMIVGSSSSQASGTSPSAPPSPIYLRDLVEISRGYQSPPRFLNFLTWRDQTGRMHRSRAVTLAVQMKEGQQIFDFGRDVDRKLTEVKQYLPADLVISRTSDQPLQVKENVDLFMDALYEAIVLVVIVSLIGFWEWRSALLMAISIPITLAMTFGMLSVLHIDIQQVSVATLIIALGLLVDDPVVANDAIKRSLADGHPRVIAAWLGPTKLATAILFATITNIVAYVPFLLLTGTTGEFLHSLPIVMTCALVASRLVSMTFLPLLGYFILRRDTKPEEPMELRRTTGFSGRYAATARFAIEHRWKFLAASLLVLVVGGVLFSRLKSSFFPEDVQYWSFVDVWLPNDANLNATNQRAQQVERIVREQAEIFGRNHPGKHQQPVLKYVSTFVGGGGPRFWFSFSPQPQQLNYAEVLIEVTDKEITPQFVQQLQPVLTASIAGARMDLRQLQTNPVEFPVQVRVSSQADVTAGQSAENIRTLRQVAGQVEDILRGIPGATRVRNDWEAESSTVSLKIDPDRANLAGVTNLDVAQSSTAAMSGAQVTTLREGDKQIPVVARLRADERSELSDIENLYVYSSENTTKIPLLQISRIVNSLQTQRIIRLEHFRTISVSCFPVAGVLPSEIMTVAKPKLLALEKNLPPGFALQIGGEYDKQQSGFLNLVVVMAISVAMIFLALLFQFNSAVKPILVFAAAPFGIAGAVAALWIMGAPFGFMAFLGIASLVGVIVSHVIVLFDFIEERREEGEPFEEAVVDAGIIRLRPVMITVGATVLALFPLAIHGGPLWQPLCYAQIGGLGVATFVTLLLVPVLYSIFVLDLKILKWETQTPPPSSTSPEAGSKGGSTGL